MRLFRNDCFLVVIDMQEKMMPVIDGAEKVIANVERLVRGFHVLDVPVLLTEQYVKGLGPTVPAIRRAFEETSGYTPMEKNCFSAPGSGEFSAAMRQLKRKRAIVCGVETHVCVFQTVTDLLPALEKVYVVADAVSSRAAANREIALQRMTAEGAKLSSTEMILFELLGTSGTDEFRAISRLVK